MNAVSEIVRRIPLSLFAIEAAAWKPVYFVRRSPVGSRDLRYRYSRLFWIVRIVTCTGQGT